MVLLTFVLAGSACGGGTKATRPTAKPNARNTLCFMPRVPHARAQPVRSHDWVKLMVQLQLGRGGVFALRDCTGRTIAWQPERDPTCSEEGADIDRSGTPRSTPIGAESVIERSLGADDFLVWVVSHHFEDGDGFGPLALARRGPDGVDVLALGTLRMRPERVNFEVWKLQKETVLVASGEVCSNAAGEKGCQRAVRLLLQRAQSLFEPPLLGPTGRCVQQSPLELVRKHAMTLPNGLHRQFELKALVRRDPRHIVIEERLLVRDTDPGAPLLPPREVQRIEANRFIQVQDGHLISKQHPLWSRVLSDRARMQGTLQ